MILLPTLNRTKLVLNFIESYKRTEAQVPVVILADHQDLKDNEAGYDEIRNALPSTIKLENTGVAQSMGDKTRFAFKRAELGIENAEWVGILNDDHYCVTANWDRKIEEMIDGTNMVSTNDGYWNFGFRVVGLTAWSKPLLDAVGFPIFPRNLQHLYIDDCWKAIGESTGCWVETMKVNIEHRHVFIGKMPEDSTFKKLNTPTSWEYDAKEFKLFMEQEFKSVCERVLKLRSEHVKKASFG